MPLWAAWIKNYCTTNDDSIHSLVDGGRPCYLGRRRFMYPTRQDALSKDILWLCKDENASVPRSHNGKARLVSTFFFFAITPQRFPLSTVSNISATPHGRVCSTVHWRRGKQATIRRGGICIKRFVHRYEMIQATCSWKWGEPTKLVIIARTKRYCGNCLTFLSSFVTPFLQSSTKVPFTFAS